ncbi:MAG TPA: hypothetical protein PKZ27_03210, partial [Rhodocyclaceae bacterium]|nr:hypothetical protein [Rhodocyclaceae bacterium]
MEWIAGYRMSLAGATATNAAAGIGQAYTDPLPAGLVYFEIESDDWNNGDTRGGIWCTDTPTDPGEWAPIGQIYSQQSAAGAADGEWWWAVYANDGFVYGDAPNASHAPLFRIGIAYNSTTRACWIRQVWDGGASPWFQDPPTGDPAAGTGPSAVFSGSEVARIAASAYDGSSVTIVAVGDHYGTPPAGFTAIGPGAGGDDGAIEGAAALAFVAAATGRRYRRAAATAGVAFAPAGTLTQPTSLIEGSAGLAFGTTAAAAAIGALGGSSTLACSAAGTGRGQAAADGDTGLAFAASAALGASAALEGATALAIAATAAATAAGKLAGAAAVALESSGALGGRAAAAGAVTLAFAATGALQQPGLVGSATLLFQAGATPAARGALGGASSLAFAAHATARQPGLVGSAAFAFDGAAALTGRAAAAGSAAFAFDGAATLTGRAAADGSSAVAFAAQATLRQPGLSGSTTLAFQVAAAPTAAGALAGAATVASAASGALGGRAAIDGAATL